MHPLTPVEPLPEPRAVRPVGMARSAAIGVGLVSLTAPAAYTVQPGDTLSDIARDHGTSAAALAELNGIDDPDHVVAGAELELPASQSDVGAATAADTGQVEAWLEEAARERGFSPRFVKAVAWQESGWNQSRVSSAGAVGVMQVLPSTGAHVSAYVVGRDLDLDDPRDNIAAGVAYLDHHWQRTGGDVEATLAAYYQGAASVEAHGRFADTDRYIANVLALRDRF